MKEALGENCNIYLLDGPYAKNIEHEERIYKLKDLLPDRRQEKSEKVYREMELR